MTIPTEITNSLKTMKLEIVIMTPDQALKILASNTSNRRMRKSVVARYSRAIKAGQWKLTQQGVAISRDGVLLDGQHRLAAVVEADVPVEMVVATECDPAIFTVLDTGAGRVAADALHINGAVNSNSAAAGLKTYILFNRHANLVWTGTGANTPTHTDIAQAYNERCDDVAFACVLASATYSTFRNLNKSALVAFTLIAIDNNYSREFIEKFYQKLCTGAGLAEYSPILRLRTALINGIIDLRSRRGNLPQVHLACLIKTFNYWIEGVEMRLFKIPAIPPMPVLTPGDHD